MTRERKDHEERKTEILDISEKLFLGNGYDDTSISDIISEAGIAKGTFYHYFDSKDHLLEELLDRTVAAIRSDLDEMVDSDDLDAVEKIIGISQYLRNFAQDKEKIVDYIHEERNAHIHFKVEKKMTPALLKYYKQIIRQGIEEDLFHVDYPDETAVTFFAMGSTLGEGRHDHTGRTIIDPQLFNAVIDISERLLGARPGLFNDYIKKMEEER